MKIIKEGTVKTAKERLYTGRCFKCGCEVECNGTEVKFHELFEAYLVNCPTNGCNERISTLPKMCNF